MGASPGFLMACRKEGVRAGARSSTCPGCGRSAPPAARCPPEGFRWVAEQFGPDVLLNVGSGGTDVCTRHRAGQPAAAGLGRRDLRPLPGRGRARRSTSDGNAVRRRAGRAGDHRADAVDAGRVLGRRRRHRATAAAYFDEYPGVWRHGDWIRFSEAGQLRHRRPLGRHPEPRRRAAGHRRVLPGRRGAARGRRQPGRAPGGPGGRQRASCCSTCSSGAGADARRRAAPHASPPRCGRRCRRGTSPTRSPRCRRSRATAPARSWSCR